jgi:4-hydroxybenzoate polyprenyltransferase
MIKFEHTIFALPFAFLGMMLAAEGWPEWRTVGWIPRTADRALPRGEVSPAFVAGFVVVSAALLVFAAWRLNPLALMLSPVALVVVLGYSYSKRFTSWSHLVLGLALAGAPLGAWIAVRGDARPAPLLVAGAVLLWVAGFDILYALQDLEFDRRRGLRSIPVRFGGTGALVVSAILHLAMLVLLALLPLAYPPGLGIGWWVGVAGCAALLGWQHRVVRPGDLSRLDAAFFRANGLLAVWLFGAAAVDLLLLR